MDTASPRRGGPASPKIGRPRKHPAENDRLQCERKRGPQVTIAAVSEGSVVTACQSLDIGGSRPMATMHSSSYWSGKTPRLDLESFGAPRGGLTFAPRPIFSGPGRERVHANWAANSGGSVAAGVQLEVADHRNHRVASCGALTGAERRVTAHCLIAFAFAALGGSPCRMGLKEYNRAFLCIRHDRHSSQHHPQKLQQCGYRIVIPECPPNPETKPPVKVRIGREFANVIRCHCPLSSVLVRPRSER